MPDLSFLTDDARALEALLRILPMFAKASSTASSNRRTAAARDEWLCSPVLSFRSTTM